MNLIASNQTSKKPVRFYASKTYIGVSTTNHSHYDYSSKVLSLDRFSGRPYNRFEYDEIYEYDDATWQHFIDKMAEIGKLSGMVPYQHYQGGYLKAAYLVAPQYA